MNGNYWRERAAALMTVLLTAALLPAVLLTGCVRKHSRGDIASYAKKISGSGSVTVSDQYVEIQEDEEGYLDHLWTVTEEGDGVSFHVLDDYYWALEKVENQLLDDYDSNAFLSLLDRGKLPIDNSISLSRSEFSGLVTVELICSFTDAQSLTKCYEELKSLRDAAEEAGYEGLKVKYTVKYQNPLRGFVDYEVDEGDTSGEIGSVDEDALALMRRNYLVCALDYRFEDVLETFPEEEVRAAADSDKSVRLYRLDADDPEADAQGRVYYEGLIASAQYDGVSFGTLYELLDREGFDPKGNAWHYSFTGPDGGQIEISYDFHDLTGFNDRNGKLQSGYYYILDDKKVRMSSYYANHFETQDIEKLTGLKVCEDRRYADTGGTD